MRRPISRSVRLVVEGLEHRLAPANNLEVVSPLDASANVATTNDGAGTITISAIAADAKLKITEIETAMKTVGVSKVIITTADPNAPDGGQAGDIVWDVVDTGDLNFAGFGTTRTLTLRAAGDIELTDLHFVLNGDVNNHSALEFDTTAGNGDVRFLAGGTHGVIFDNLAVSSLAVNAGSGTITYENTPTPAGLAYASTLGDITFTASAVTLSNSDGFDAVDDIAVSASNIQVGGPLIADSDVTLTGGAVTLTSASGVDAGGNIGVSGTNLQLGASLIADVDITLTGGAVTLSSGVGVDAGDDIVITGTNLQLGGALVADGDVSVTGGPVTLANVFGVDAGGGIAVSATSLQLGASLAADGDISVTGPVTLTSDVAIGRVPGDPSGASNSVTLAGTVNGAHKLNLNAIDVAIQQSIGATTSLTALKFDGGDVVYGNHPLSATNITIGDSFLAASTPLVSFVGTGTLTGAVEVKHDATVSPGGDGAAGTLPIVGNLTFTGGVLDIDLGSTSDLLQVTGNVSLSPSSSFLDVDGFIPNIADVKIVDFTGTMTGNFLNAAVVNQSPILTESDILTVSHYGPAGTGITLAPLAIPFNAVGGNEFDGTGYVARLLGPGVLGAVIDQAGVVSLATHGTTTASKLIVTTAANASDDVIRFANVFIHGSLGALVAAKADAEVRVDGTIQSISLRTVDGLTIGGLPTNRTSLSAASIPGAVSTSGGFSSIKVAGSIAGNLAASSIGTLKAGSVEGDVAVIGAIASINTTAGYTGDLSAGSLGTATIGTVLGRLGAAPAEPRTTWTITGRVGTLSASGIAHSALTATSMGTLNVTAKLKAGLGGHLADSLFTITGNTGVAAGRMALKTVRVAGAVSDSLFDIEDGNVDSVTVGRFVNSRFYLGYDPNGAFNTGGQFDLNKLGKLNKFTTMAKTLGQDFNPSNFAFVGSQVVANTFGKVLLSGLQTANGGVAFGFKFHTSPGSIRVASAGPAGIPLDVDLDPNSSPFGHFFLIAG